MRQKVVADEHRKKDEIVNDTLQVICGMRMHISEFEMEIFP
jgi:hypothetical protein